MEAAASGQAYSEALQGGSPPDAASVLSIGGIHASLYGAPSDVAIESAHRFWWDKEEDQAGKGMHNKCAADDAQGFLGERTAPGSSAGAVLNRLLGGFRCGVNEAEEYMEKPPQRPVCPGFGR